MSSAQEDPPPVFHSHCDTCIDINCVVRFETNVACDMVRCPQDCGSRYHACKADDHMILCPNVRVCCTNAWYGCRASKNKMGIKNHLQHCPANVVMCGELVHREHYHDHFCSEDHDHKCEPSFVKWVEENNARPIGAAFQTGLLEPEVTQQFENIYGPRPVQHKSQKQSNKPDNIKVDEENEGGNGQKRSVGNQSIKNQNGFKELHTVPWQYRQSLTSDSNDSEGPVPDPTTPDEMNVPSTPFAEGPPSLSHSLESLPILVLQEIGRYLDRKTLGILAVSSKHMRHVCSSLLQEKGMVEMCWEKREGSWQITKKIWHFGNLTIED